MGQRCPLQSIFTAWGRCISVSKTDEVLELFNRRQRQILVHSFLYYEQDKSVIEDHLYDSWCTELADLIQSNYEEFKRSQYYEAFIGFDGSSGFDLPYRSPDIVTAAHRLLNSINYLQRREQ